MADPAFWIAGTNALINTTSAVVIVRARQKIRERNIYEHRRLMIIGALLQGLFLVLYLIKTYVYGTTPFEGDPAIRIAYLLLLGAHIIAATVSAPLVLITLFLGLRRMDASHRAFAQWTYPLWVFSSVTGPLTFVMLYVFGRPGFGVQALGS